MFSLGFRVGLGKFLPWEYFLAACCLEESSGNDAPSEHAAVECVPLTVTVSRGGSACVRHLGGEEPYQRHTV